MGEIGSTSGCNCFFTNRGSGARRAVFIGTYKQVALAQSTIWEQMRSAMIDISEELDADAHVVVFIRREAIGAVLGKEGTQLKAVREQSEAFIKVENEEFLGH